MELKSDHREAEGALGISVEIAPRLNVRNGDQLRLRLMAWFTIRRSKILSEKPETELTHTHEEKQKIRHGRIQRQFRKYWPIMNLKYVPTKHFIIFHFYQYFQDRLYFYTQWSWNHISFLTTPKQTVIPNFSLDGTHPDTLQTTTKLECHDHHAPTEDPAWDSCTSLIARNSQ